MKASKHIIKYSLMGLASICLLQACSDKGATETPSKTEASDSATQIVTTVEKTADGVV